MESCVFECKWNFFFNYTHFAVLSFNQEKNIDLILRSAKIKLDFKVKHYFTKKIKLLSF